MLTTDRDDWPLPLAELEPALALVLTLQNATMGVMMLQEERTGSLRPVLGRGLTDEQVHRFDAYRAHTSPFGASVANRRRVSIPDAWVSDLSPLARELNFRALDIFPLCRVEGMPYGVVAVMFDGVGSHAAAYPAVDLCTKLLVCALENAHLRRHAERAKGKAEQIALDKVEFLARLSHELRNPLNALSGYLDLLRLDLATGLTEPQAILMDRVRRTERILVNIIDDLITFAKLEVGHVHYEIGPVGIGEIIDAAALVIAPVAQARNLAFHVHVPDRRLVIEADGSRVRQILTNLLTNAIKFTSQGGTIQLTCTAAGPDTVEFNVSDTGTGIPRDKLDAIFRPYVQAGPPIIDGFGGSGLGLAISREFAEAMRGRLTASSIVGQGSTFTLALPRSQRRVPAGLPAKPPRPDSPRPRAPSHRFH